MPIKRIVFYSKRLPPKYIGGIETNAYYLIAEFKACGRYQVAALSVQRYAFFFQRNKQLWYNGQPVEVRFITKKQRNRRELLVDIIGTADIPPEQTLIYHNTLDLHPHFDYFRRLGYRQLARSGGNDIFFLQTKNTSTEGLIPHINLLDGFIVNSQYSLNRSIALGIEESKLYVIRGGCVLPQDQRNIPVHGWPADSTAPVILTCGRLVDFKGIDDAIQAMAILKSRNIAFNYVVVGEGELSDRLQRLAAEKDVADRCYFIGKILPGDMPAIFNLGDIYLSSSKDVTRTANSNAYVHTETMGRSICEAQAHGLPVVSTDAGGTPEMVVDGKTGLVVPQNNPSAIANALEQLITDHALRNRLSENARNHAFDCFSWSAVFRQTEDIIARLSA